MNRESINEVNGYLTENLFSSMGLDFSEKMETIKEIFNKYDEFIKDIELFFNSQLEDNDLDKFKGDMFELSDADGKINFPFCIKDKKLKFIETDAWRVVIITSIAMKEIKEKKRIQ